MYSKSHIPVEAQGTEYNELMHVTDWIPTIAKAAGVRLEGRSGITRARGARERERERVFQGWWW